MNWRSRSAGAALGVAVTTAAAVGLGVRLAQDAEPNPGAGALATVSTGTPAGTVPSVFAHTRGSATALLQEAGLSVSYDRAVSCDPEGRPVGTEPAAGTRVARGDTVTLLIGYQAANTDCSMDLREPWRFMDFATGLGTSPAFADEVTLHVDRDPPMELAGPRAAAGEWGEPSALTALRASAGQVVGVDGEIRTPILEVRAGTPPDAFCGIPRPAPLGDREALTLTVSLPGLRSQCPTRVSLYRTDGRIDAVMAWTSRQPPDASMPGPTVPAAVPDVVGLPLDQARAAVTAAGLTAIVEQLETCDPAPGVVEQAPTQRDVEDDADDDPDWSGVVTLVVEVPHTTRDCAALDAAAAGFVRFARGGPPPDWAPAVRQLFGHALLRAVTASQADDPEAWAYCSGSAGGCGPSPLDVAARGQTRTGEWAESIECEMVDRGGLPEGLYAEDHVVVFPASPLPCSDAWSVELWIDGMGRISAVNLLVAEAAVGD